MLIHLPVRKNPSVSAEATKRQITLTGILAGVLTPGRPAFYLYQGSLIRTSAVQAILETSPDYVRFETRNSIYTISYDKAPDELQSAA